MRKIKIIFLDIDGVLNSMAYFKSQEHQEKRFIQYDEIDESRLPLLKQIVDATGAKIVLSSTWRELDDCKDAVCYEMYKYLEDMLAKYDMSIMSKTPVAAHCRPLEITMWLNKRFDKNEITFVSLDDDFGKDAYDKYSIGNNLVHTCFYSEDPLVGGIQPEHVEQAIRILNKEY